MSRARPAADTPRNVRLQPPKPSTRNARREAAPPPRPPLRERLGAIREHAAAGLARLRRPAWIAVRVVLAVAVVAGAVGVARLIERHVRTSPAFATRTITVQNDGGTHLTRDEALRVAGIAEGRNVFEVAPEDAEARLRHHPWIAAAEVRRRLPGTYEVRIRERQPSAILALAGEHGTAMYLIGDDGTVFKRLGDEDPVDLPVITGLDRRRFTQDRAFRASILLEVVALLSDWRAAGLWRREPIAEVHVEADDGLSLYLGSDATYVRLGRGPFRRKLRRLREVLDTLERRDANPAYVYLDNVRRPDRVTVRIR